MGHARTAAVRWGANHEHQERQEPALASMAERVEPMPRALHVVLEYADTKPRKTSMWFALDGSRPLCPFAGLWRSWHGTRGPKASPVEGEHRLYGFPTINANGVVDPVHPKADRPGPLAQVSRATGVKVVATGENEDRHNGFGDPPSAPPEQPDLL